MVDSPSAAAAASSPVSEDHHQQQQQQQQSNSLPPSTCSDNDDKVNIIKDQQASSATSSTTDIQQQQPSVVTDPAIATAAAAAAAGGHNKLSGTQEGDVKQNLLPQSENLPSSPLLESSSDPVHAFKLKDMIDRGEDSLSICSESSGGGGLQFDGSSRFSSSATLLSALNNSSSTINLSIGAHGLTENTNNNNNNSGGRLSCEMCANYEYQLQQLQDSERKVKQELASLTPQAERYRTELSGERVYRAELEEKMGTLSQEVLEKIGFLHDKCIAMEKRSDHASQKYNSSSLKITDKKPPLSAETTTSEPTETSASNQSPSTMIKNHRLPSNYPSAEAPPHYELMKSHVMKLTKQAEVREREFVKLREDYQRLLGRQRAASAAMEQQDDSHQFLPQTVDDLQLRALQLREELISTKAAKEHLEASLTGDIHALREQFNAQEESKLELESTLSAEVNKLRTELAKSRSAVECLREEVTRTTELERQVGEYQRMIGDLETKMASLQSERGELEFSNTEARKRLQQLQQELNNSETVQRDFVNLSQSLQMELEKIRQAETEVRWESKSDALICPACRNPFNKSRDKINCRHCGKVGFCVWVFCGVCLSKSVLSGASRRAARVCDVCYTLLNRDTKPYFSETVPNFHH